MRIAVIGCGAMGALYGGYLSRKNDVTHRGCEHHRLHCERCRADGLQIAEPDGSSAPSIIRRSRATRSGMAARRSGDRVRQGDAQRERRWRTNRALIGPDTYLMTLQNGSGHEEVLRRFADDAHVVIGTTQHNSAVAGHWARSATAAAAWTHIGALVGRRGAAPADCATRLPPAAWRPTAWQDVQSA